LKNLAYYVRTKSGARKNTQARKEIDCVEEKQPGWVGDLEPEGTGAK